MLNYYFVLGLRPGASRDEIRAAYRLRARDTHPDTGGDPASFARISQAYKTLFDAKTRDHWETEYRETARRANEIVCECCFAAQKLHKHCRICGACFQPEKNLPPPVDKLLSDITDQIGDTAIELGARIGDVLAKATIEAVNRGVRRLRRRY